MYFIFLTRCCKPDNIRIIKYRLQEVFKKSVNKPMYEQVIIVDPLAQNIDRFNVFKDSNTKVVFVSEKENRDDYMAKNMDDILSTYEDRDDAYVYILDDDNVIDYRFLDICKKCNGEDLIFFKIHPCTGWASPNIANTKHAVGNVDWANFITKLSVMKRLKIYKEGDSSRCCDGYFASRALEDGCSTRFIEECLGYYNFLPKP